MKPKHRRTRAGVPLKASATIRPKVIVAEFEPNRSLASQNNSKKDDEPEPVEECLTNKNELKPEIVQELTQQTQKLGRMIRKLNKKQQMHCSENRKDEESYRMCPNWREEKMIHYYKLMRITYCQDVDKWPNAPRFKRTYAQQLSLFETLYVFNKQ